MFVCFLIFAVPAGVIASPTFHYAKVICTIRKESLITAKSQRYVMLKDLEQWKGKGGRK